MSLTQEDTELLRNFVQCVFDRWYGLQAAIQHGMGGGPAETRSKLDNMTATIAGLCSRPDISEEELSDALEDIADSYFDIVFEDGSVDEVAHHLWSDTRDLFAGNSDRIKTFVNKKTPPTPVIPTPHQPVEEQMDADDVDSDRGSESDSVPAIDDGWEVPRYGRRKR